MRLQLAPLTIVIGKNGGGKSVLTRLPVLLAGGLASNADEPVNLMAGGISHAARYEDLVHQRSAQPFMLGLEISDGTDVWAFKSTLRLIVERHAVGFESFELIENGESRLSLSAATPEDIGKEDGEFNLATNGRDALKVKNVEWAGLFPTALEGSADASSTLAAARALFHAALGTPAYLGPFRTENGWTGRVARQGIRSLGPRGEGALDLLGDDAIRGSGELIELVADWFGGALGGNRVVLQTDGGIPRLLVNDPARGLEVDLSETGAGFAQVLPIAVQTLARRQGLLDCSISIVEQPELHLHPAAHGAVADLFVDNIAADQHGVVYICETHSEQFVTRLRRRVAEGAIHPASVRIISVGHQAEDEGEAEPVRTINLDRYGNPDAWPVGVFDEALNDLILLKDAGQLLDAEQANAG